MYEVNRVRGKHNQYPTVLGFVDGLFLRCSTSTVSVEGRDRTIPSLWRWRWNRFRNINPPEDNTTDTPVVYLRYYGIVIRKDERINKENLLEVPERNHFKRVSGSRKPRTREVRGEWSCDWAFRRHRRG